MHKYRWLLDCLSVEVQILSKLFSYFRELLNLKMNKESPHEYGDRGKRNLVAPHGDRDPKLDLHTREVIPFASSLGLEVRGES